MHKWLDKFDIVDPDHVEDLETHAAIKEFTHKLPRHEAEEKAYEDYKKDQIEYSAAHHLAGMKAAQGAGDNDAARMHGTLYQTALKQLGHPEVGEVPTSIANKMKHEPSKVYRFKAHDSDAFLGDSAKPKEEQSLAKSIAQVVVGRLLKGNVIDFPKQPQQTTTTSPEKAGKMVELHPKAVAAPPVDYSHLLTPEQRNQGLSLTVRTNPNGHKMADKSILNRINSDGSVNSLVSYNYHTFPDGGGGEGFYWHDEDAENTMDTKSFLPQLKAAFHTHFKTKR